jgi:hypothetical protein
MTGLLLLVMDCNYFPVGGKARSSAAKEVIKNIRAGRVRLTSRTTGDNQMSIIWST